MRLTQLKLAGFKSFADPIVIPTPGDLVGVVGPNGCGKSNIIDAVRWVMGESRASELRGESMQDVIFNGSGQRKPAGRASVELVFDNSEGRAAGQWSSYAEISVKRVLTRDGNSSYFINNQVVRRRDVYDIFLGTGLGARGYAIIGQGMVNRLIEARPEELRVYLEEAAGVTRYKERRRETGNRLRDTRENLVRVEDILRELNKQLEKLEVQAEVASRFQALKDESRKKQHMAWFVSMQHAKEKQLKLAQSIEQAQNQLESNIAALRSQEAKVEELRQAHYDAANQLHKIQGNLYEAGAQVSRLETELRHLNESRHRMVQRKGQLQQQSQQWQDQIAHSNDQIQQLQDQREQLLEQSDELEARIEVASSGLPDIENDLSMQTRKRDNIRSSMSETDQQLAVMQQSVSTAQQRLQVVDTRIERLEQSLLQLERPNSHCLDKLQAQHSHTQDNLEKARDLLAQHEINQAEAESKLVSAQEQLNSARTELATIQAQYTALSELQNSVQQPEGVSGWLDEVNLNDASPIWQQAQTEAGWEKALEACLDYRIAAVGVDNLAHWITNIQSYPPARLAVYQLDSQPVVPLDAPTKLNAEPFISKIKCNVPHVNKMLGLWLQNVYACNSMNEALQLQPYLTANAVLVLPQGHMVDSHSVRFYASETEQAGLIARQAEINNLEKQIKAQKLHVNSFLNTLENARAHADSISYMLKAERKNVSDLTSTVHEQHIKITRLQQQLLQAQDADERIKRDISELKQEKLELTQSIDDSLAKINDLQYQRERHQEELQRANSVVDSLFQQAQEHQNTTRGIERKMHEVSTEIKALDTRLVELNRALELATTQKRESESELERLQGELFEIDEAALTQSLQEAIEARLKHEENLNAARVGQDNAAALLREADEKRLELERDAEPARSAITDLQLKEHASRLSVEQLKEQLKNDNANIPDLEKFLQDAPEQWHKPEWLQSQVKRINIQIDSLGPVNLAALDELKAAQERHAFMSSQYEDLSKAINTLEDAIRQIDRETRSLLQDTFDKANGFFGELFPKLFGGGEAHLTMTGEEILDAGVQVMAQPPGKRNSTIQLLSGGEKALTAIALIFALFKLNPAPFCLLDEVDAPLDDANTDRYARLVSSMSDQTQFIFVTHNKIAMNMAQQLIGVTMQEQGVSRIVAVDLDAAMQMAG